MAKKKDIDEVLGIHRYGIRMPKSLFEVIREMAWQSRTSVNRILTALVAESLARGLRENHGIPISLGLPGGLDDGFEGIATPILGEAEIPEGKPGTDPSEWKWGPKYEALARAFGDLMLWWETER